MAGNEGDVMLVKNSKLESEVSVVQVDKINDVPGKELELQRSGLTRKKAYETLSLGLSATRAVKDKYGDVVEEVPDHAVRHKYLETALKIYGDLKDKTELEVGHKISDNDKELLIKYGVIKKEE